jgi:membrane-bound lytic murein transglycosylase D
MDERRDFRKSTVAALKKLEENYRALGNWPLAMAAYNAGLNGVRRAMQQANTSNYWVLCEKNVLKTETIHYVPKLLAVSYILSNPRQFGVDWWPEPFEWTVIKPVRQASLDLLAAETGTDRDLLYRLNPELLHGITPAEAGYELVVPSAKAPMISAILEMENVKLLTYYRYQIQSGDTLSALSRHYGVSVSLIEQHNPGISNRFLRIGETIVIPAFRETSPYASGTPAARNPQAAFNGTHRVVQGDSLWSLARRYRVDPHVLAAENNMDLNQILSIGKVLKVPILE